VKQHAEDRPNNYGLVVFLHFTSFHYKFIYRRLNSTCERMKWEFQRAAPKSLRVGPRWQTAVTASAQCRVA